MIGFLFLCFYALIGCWLASILFCVLVGIRAVREIKQEEELERQEQAIIHLAEQIAQEYENRLDQLA